MRGGLRYVCVAILCSLCAVQPAEAAKHKTVKSELRRMLDAGTLAPDAYSADTGIYADARAKVKKLSGARRLELSGVIRDLEDMAARGQFTPTRMPPLFLTLQRNTEYWTTRPLISSGARVTFPPSQLVWQLYAGHGIQIQWLGTFGTLNALGKSKRNNTKTDALLTEALPLASQRAGGLAWEYLFPFDGQRPPWVSSLAQGTGLQAMARAAVRLGRQAEVMPILHEGLGIFEKSPPQGVRIPDGAGAHYLQYSGLPTLKIINGFIQSLVGLYDYASLSGDPLGQSLFQAGDTAGRAEVAEFDTGAWSLYSLGSSLLRVQPELPHAAARLPRPAVLAHGGGRVLRRGPALHRLSDDPAGHPGAAGHAQAQEAGQAALPALEDLARDPDRDARHQGREHAGPRHHQPWAQDGGLARAETDRRLHGERERDGSGRQPGQRDRDDPGREVSPPA